MLLCPLGSSRPSSTRVLQPDENQQLSQAFMSFDCELATWATLSFKMMELKMNCPLQDSSQLGPVDKWT